MFGGGRGARCPFRGARGSLLASRRCSLLISIFDRIFAAPAALWLLLAFWASRRLSTSGDFFLKEIFEIKTLNLARPPGLGAVPSMPVQRPSAVPVLKSHVSALEQ